MRYEANCNALRAKVVPAVSAAIFPIATALFYLAHQPEIALLMTDACAVGIVCARGEFKTREKIALEEASLIESTSGNKKPAPELKHLWTRRNLYY